MVVAALLVCVLEVLVVRLSVQPFQTLELDVKPALSAEDGTEETTAQTESRTVLSVQGGVVDARGLAQTEGVVRLRETPYSSIVDCVRSIWRDEGPAVLLRAFWITFFFTQHGTSLLDLYWQTFGF